MVGAKLVLIRNLKASSPKHYRGSEDRWDKAPPELNLILTNRPSSRYETLKLTCKWPLLPLLVIRGGPRGHIPYYSESPLSGGAGSKVIWKQRNSTNLAYAVLFYPEYLSLGPSPRSFIMMKDV